jgi:surfactin synthase thioesterase subunit
MYQRWTTLLPAGIELCLIQLPGREGRIGETAYTRLGPLIESTAAAITPLLTVPFAFFGHSMGALIAFELTRYLRRRGVPAPAHLFVSAARAPDHEHDEPSLAGLSDDDFIQEVQCRYQSLPEAVLADGELMALVLPTMRRDFELLDAYAYGHDEPLACPITCFGGAADRSVTEAHLAAWRTQTTGAFAVSMCPGHHLYLSEAAPLVVKTITLALQTHLRSTAGTTSMAS